ncbi:hypothetical protein [Rothia mucilaginosa]|jgi:hypothetical protein|uniref:hypothetical protein n=1 Tax=Rothia mucilaginosa TaxID=43675 RepID=UPI00288BB4B6|nr:hypothetical protein [Rothia mucilaginosa]
MSQLPQNDEDFDYNPEYAKLYQEDDSQPSDAEDTDDWSQRASEQPSEVQGAQDGERAANFSLLFGFLGPLSFFLGFWLLVQGLGPSSLMISLAAPVLNILGIWQGRVAQRHGVRALGGRILNGLGLCFFIGIAFLIMLIANALSHIN